MTLAQLVQAMEEPATPGHPRRAAAADPAAARSASRATRSCATAIAELRELARAPARTAATSTSDGTYERRRRDHADGRLVAEAGRRRVRAGARRRRASQRCRRCSPSATAAAAPARRAGLLRRLVRLRLEGPARPVRAEARARPLVARLLRRRLRSALPRGAPAARCARRSTVTPEQLYGHGDCASDPRPQCFDQNRFDGRLAVSHAAVPVPEPPDVPADGLAHPRRPLDLGWPAGRGLYAAPRQGSQRSKGEVLEFQQSSLRRGRFPAAALALALLPSAASAATPQPYGTHDAGGFRNVLPPERPGSRASPKRSPSSAAGPRRRTSRTSSRCIRTCSTHRRP